MIKKKAHAKTAKKIVLPNLFRYITNFLSKLDLYRLSRFIIPYLQDMKNN